MDLVFMLASAFLPWNTARPVQGRAYHIRPVSLQIQRSQVVILPLEAQTYELRVCILST